MDSKERLLKSVHYLLKPLTRLLIRNGVSYAEFGEIAKQVYVETALADFRLEKRKMSDSRISVLTGLTRKDVRRLRALIESGQIAHKRENFHRASRVLSGWHNDDAYSHNGQANTLPIEGDGSFAELVRLYSSETPTKAMLEELLRVKAVYLDKETDMVTALTSAYLPSGDHIEGLRLFGTAVHDLGATMEHNINPKRDGEKRFQRTVFSRRLSEATYQELIQFVNDRGGQWAEELDTWLCEHQDTEPHPDHISRAGLSLFLFRED